jgi:Homeodomain-like domain-containing protein
MVQPVQVRPISDVEGNRLLRIVRRGTGSVVTWRRAQMVLLSAQGMPVATIAEVTFTSPDRVRDVLHNFTADGFDSLYPRLRRRAAAEVRPAAADRDQEDRAEPHGRPRPAVLDLEPVQAGRLPGRRGGGRRHQPRGPARVAPRGGRQLSNGEDLEDQHRPELRGEDQPGAGALRHRRPHLPARPRRPEHRVLRR